MIMLKVLVHKTSRNKLILAAVCVFALIASALSGCTPTMGSPQTVEPATLTPEPIDVTKTIPTDTPPGPSATVVATTEPAPSETPAVETTVPVETTAPAVSSTPERLVIDPSNVNLLQQVGAFDQEGATLFTWLADSNAVAVAGQEQIVLFGSVPPDVPAQVSAAMPTNLASSQDETILAWSNEDNSVSVLDLTAGGEPVQLVENTSQVTDLAFGRQGDRLAVGLFDNELQILDASSGEIQKSISLPYWLDNLSFSPDDSLIAGVEAQSFTVHVFDVETGEEQRTFTWTGTASPVLYAALFSPDWSQIAWVARGTVQLMDYETGVEGVVLSHEDFISDTAWSPDSQLLATTTSATVDGNPTPVVIIWDAATGEQISVIPTTEVAIDLSFAPDGRALGMLFNSGQLQIWGVPP
jgi:WD40 repeat protein